MMNCDRCVFVAAIVVVDGDYIFGGLIVLYCNNVAVVHWSGAFAMIVIVYLQNNIHGQNYQIRMFLCARMKSVFFFV